jgi:hypothetical protein
MSTWQNQRYAWIGFISNHSIFLRLPFGAGSNGVTGVRVYVTVLVTTCLTLTGRGAADRGAS